MVESKFKKTEIGLIPEDWSIANWNDIFDFKSTASYSRAEVNIQGNVGYLHYGDIYTKIKATLDINKFVSGYISNKQVKTYSFIKEGDLIMADASEDQSGIGKSFEVINQPHNPVISGLHTFLIREKKNCTLAKGFKAYFYFNPLIKKQYDALATGLKVYSLSKGSFNHIQIPLPPLPEQQAIAKVLLETDAWIDSLENIIAKKRQVKQGAMQMLLTPNEDWKVKKLGDVAQFRRGSFPQPYGLSKWYDDNNGVPFIQVYDVGKNRKLKNDTKRKISALAQPMSVFVPKGQIVITLQGSIGRIALTQYEAFCDRTILIFEKITSKINKYYFLLRVEQIFESEKEKAPGGTIKTITKEALSNFYISFPKSLKEQTRIANVLFDMDTEIEHSEKKLAKAKQLKQGMMQQLLTGKIRLINAIQTS